MAAKGSSCFSVERGFGGLGKVLGSAVLEWMLILLLLVNALFSYLVSKYARFFGLRTPCLLCSRLDHVIGDEKPGFYWDSVCDKHNQEIYSLVLETEKRAKLETKGLLVGQLGEELEHCVDDAHVSSEKHCPSCNKPWRLSSEVAEFIGSTEVVEFDLPLVEQPSSWEAVPSSNVETRGFDPMSQSELKIVSDSEPEVLVSDDDDVIVLIHGNNDFKIEIVAQPIEVEIQADIPDILFKTLSDDLASEKLIYKDYIPDTHDLIISSASAVDFGNGLEELNRNEVEQKDHTSAISDFVSVDEGPSSNVAEISDLEELTWNKVGEQSITSALSELVSIHGGPSLSNTAEPLIELPGLEELNWNAGEQKSNSSPLSEHTLVHEAVSPSNTIERHAEVPGETCDIGLSPISESGEVSNPESGLSTTGLKMDQVVTNPLPSLMDLTDAYKLVVSNKRNQVTSVLVEQLTGKDTTRASEDLKLLLSQISAARGLEFSWSEVSPRLLQSHQEDSKAFDASSSVGLQILQKRISLERNESGFESLDGSIISEIEGESGIDRLKRQVENDHKSMSALYKELEEERNASAVAANQAMAMITRLQEEKAELQMEALQFLRMMEEQSEYDAEALQKANDLLYEKEKEVQNLEAELTFYREKSRRESTMGNNGSRF
ncbi:hypothetical protein GIB67_023986 [Kingdonia uniflora]|uniref:GTD-binding domain-containing protein n=1 Tax=Kingdonia uniflora TaxID=39325 RepID=A0A7J7LPS3_9MAGN|nr:hypothetical protein GIB67_023986 [Kingdonia uniflora]